MNKVILFCGTSSVGKSAVLKSVVHAFKLRSISPAYCKIDCAYDIDHETFSKLDIPSISGVSDDICPDHFLVSNLADLWAWANNKSADCLFIETAGLCHRCSPATNKMIAGCVVDGTASCKAPEHMGPMLKNADFVVVTKTDMISQAEREIVCFEISRINDTALVFPVDGLAGYGIDALCEWIIEQPTVEEFEGDFLRHTMPAGVCSYCVGERRVGCAFQQGVVGKMNIN